MILKFPFLASTRTRLVVDLYDPFLLENLHYYLNDPMEDQEKINRQAVEVTNHLSCIGDFFICGSERQRDFWMGVLAANGRVNPRTFRHDGTLRSLIDVVGIGFPKRAPRRGPLLRGNHPAIPVTARIVLWGGGVWNWLDPLTLVKAWPQVISHHPEARLVILGTRHPNPLVPQHEMAERTEALATEIGEKDRTIHIIEWLPYEEREALLCEADIGVTLHPIHVETRYSIRTRVLDYMWARLPILITDGDITSEWVRRFDLGIVVPPLNVDAVASALIEMLEKPKEAWDPAFKPLNDTFEWSRVVEPLRRYCLEGDHAPDWKQHRVSTTVSLNDDIHRNYLVRGFSILRSQGIRELLSRSWRHIQWRLGRF
jgi:glycosyltransferase involved in cell wall biosynthesis